jgi:tol-pal system protein YbgF
MTRKILIASTLALSVALAGGVAWSQTPMPDPLDDRSVKRLERMEKVVRVLRSIVFQGRDSGKPVVVQPAETEGQLQGLAQRIVDLEETLTSLNRQNEATTFELDQTRRALTEAQAANRALADRLSALEARTGKIEADALAGDGTEEEDVADAADDPDAEFAAARKLMLNGDYDAAYVAFDRFVSRYGDTPQGPEGRYWLGKTLSVRGDHGGAAGAYIGAIRGWPKTAWAPDAVLELSRSLIALKKPADACQTLDELARRYPKAPAGVLNRAQATRVQAKCGA